MSKSNSEAKQPVMVRLPHQILEEVQHIAQRESESQSIVLRRLLRAGLDAERRLGAQR